MIEWWRRILHLIQRRRWNADLEEELRVHARMRAAEHAENGADPADAAFHAQRDLGNATLIRERSRAVWGWTWLETALADIGYALRQMLRNPGFTFVALTSLALGIAANTTVFSLIDAMWLRMLPVREPEQLVRVYTWGTPVGAKRPGVDDFSWPLFDIARKRSTVLTDLAAHYSTAPFQISAAGETGEVEGAVVSANYFSMLGVQPALGRFFLPRKTRCVGEMRSPSFPTFFGSRDSELIRACLVRPSLSTARGFRSLA